jgi:GNAT superfamily N-acetyltransferase
MTAVEVLGYVASVLAAASFLMKSVLRLRVVSLVASVCFSVYGYFLNSIPIAGLNFLIVFINLYFIIQMLTKKTFFKLLEVDRHSAYLQAFLAFYQSEIGRFFPSFEYRPDRTDMAYLILRDLLPVGVFISERDASGRAVVKLDFVIPGYRDLKAGQFLYRELEQRLPARGITTLYSVPGSALHHAYLVRMGFNPRGSPDKIKLYARELKTS